MKVDRLFNVLVLGGAAIAASCGDDKAPAEGAAQGGHGGDGGSATAQGAGGASSVSSTAQGGGGGAESDAGAQAGGGSGGSAGSMAAEGGLACSPTPSPTDPCGCPCCWVGNCINTDPCCEAFSRFCTKQ